jgi:histidinol-phosphate aminotransferase
MDIAPYKAARGHPGAVRYQLASNESVIGPSPAAIEAYRSAASQIHLYPDGAAHEFREAIAAVHSLDSAHIVCGNGSDELLTLSANAYLRAGDEVLFSAHAFLVYRLAALANSATPVAAPEPGLRVDVDRMLALVTRKTRVVYVANPNNPTGTFISPSEMRRLHAGLPPQTLLVIDSAYAEYMRDSDYEAGRELVSQFGNVVMTRTFSKAYGACRLASRMGVLSRQRCGRAQSPPRTVQCVDGRAARRHGGPSRSRASRARGGAQRAMAQLANGRNPRARLAGRR